MTDETWVALRTFQGPLEAEMAHAFLRDHGVRAMVRGPSSTIHSLVRFVGPTPIVLYVPREDEEDAREALEALVPATGELPFRGPIPRTDAPPPADRRDAPAASGPRPRSVVAVLVASSVLPIATAHVTQGCGAPGVVAPPRADLDVEAMPREVEANDPLAAECAGRPSMRKGRR